MQPPKIKCIDLKMEFQVSIAMATITVCPMQMGCISDSK